MNNNTNITIPAHSRGGVEIFTAAEFDMVMREIAPTDARCIGVQKGEYVWVIPVLGVGADTIGVFVRSSIRADGASAEAGADSIRAWLGHIPDGEPYAPKVLGRWTTRRKGWQIRLRRVVKELVLLARHIRPCPTCGMWMKLRAPGGSGSSAGTRPYLYCDAVGSGMLDFTDDGVELVIPGLPCGTTLPIPEVSGPNTA